MNTSVVCGNRRMRAVLTMVVCSFFPLGVQSQSDRFGEITCTQEVVGPDGSLQVRLGGDLLRWPYAPVFISDLEYGGDYGYGGSGSAMLGVTKYGGTVARFWHGKGSRAGR